MHTAELYRSFASREARGQSDCYEQWAEGLAGDPQLLRLVETLPGLKKQPNLVFAAARYVGIEPGPFAAFRAGLLDRWPDVRDTVLTRRTQTNEVGRLTSLLPIFAALPQPLALLEVGASAGLCLYPDKYSYDYVAARRLDPVEGPAACLLSCDVTGPAPIPNELPTVVWRAGIDLNPLDVTNQDDVGWLDTLVWPGQESRRRRLSAAIEIARTDPPHLVAGDLNEAITDLARQRPADATLVIFHSAVLIYLRPDDRRRFISTLGTLPCHWISNEGSSLPLIPDESLPPPLHPDTSSFVVRKDSVALAYAGPHGQYLHWFG
jgi:hypothetical protein